MKILLVDDDHDMLAVTSFALQQAGFLVVKAGAYDAALTTFHDEQPDLAILDINLPGGSGFDLCAAIRRESQIPVLMLTVRSDEPDLVRALDLGADDYLAKPYSPRTLVARVKALLRRAGRDDSARTRSGVFELDADTLTLKIEGREPLRVTPLEARLLQLLLANAGKVVYTERLLAHVWGYRGGGDRQLLKQLVHRLRQKLQTDADSVEWLETVPSVGYKLRLER